jgi:hypothetical protein
MPIYNKLTLRYLEKEKKSKKKREYHLDFEYRAKKFLYPKIQVLQLEAVMVIFSVSPPSGVFSGTTFLQKKFTF